MSAPRVLVVNADDLGLSPGVNAGVARAHRDGVVTSASLLVRGAAAAGAAALARRLPRLAVGLHVDLGEWRHAAGGWQVVYEVVPGDDAEAVEREVRAQLARFAALLARPPTHLDSHQHVHRADPARSVLARVAGELGVPLRGVTPSIRHCGDFYGQSGRGDPHPAGITAEHLAGLVAALPPGTTELACHPAAADDTGSVYGEERVRELEALCDPRVRAAVRAGGVALRSFAELG